MICPSREASVEIVSLGSLCPCQPRGKHFLELNKYQNCLVELNHSLDDSTPLNSTPSLFSLLKTLPKDPFLEFLPICNYSRYELICYTIGSMRVGSLVCFVHCYVSSTLVSTWHLSDSRKHVYEMNEWEGVAANIS